MTHFVVTGSSGFIGTNLVKRLLELENNYVIGLDKKTAQITHDNYNHIDIDLGSIKVAHLLQEKLCLPEDYYLIHLAAQTSSQISMENPCQDLNSNLISLKNILEFFENYKSAPKLILFSSSMAVYGNASLPPMGFSEDQHCSPASVYGYTKLISEYILSKSHIPSISARLFNVYGKGQDLQNMKQGMLSIYMTDMIKNGKIHIKGSIKRTRDFIHVQDVVNAFINLINKSKQNSLSNHEVINICTGDETSVQQIVEFMTEAYLIQSGIRCSSFAEGNTPGDMFRSFGNSYKHLTKFGFKASHTLKHEISEMVKWATEALK